MAIYFLDTSALAKRYVTEPGSSWVLSLTDLASGNQCWISALAPVEFLALLYRRVRSRQLTILEAHQAEQVFRRDLGALFRTIAPIPLILNRAMDLVTVHPLRGYDAVQLATGLYLQAQQLAAGMAAPIFLSADQNLNSAPWPRGCKSIILICILRAARLKTLYVGCLSGHVLKD
jgi:predicted nucleic acid-binding protein